MRLLGLDYGRKRIGMAVSDPLGITAQPLGYIPQNGEAMARLAEIVKKHEVKEIVLGYPRSLSGAAGPMAKEVEAFENLLKEKLGVGVHLWDERFTTSQVENLLISADVRRDKRKEVRDMMAASLILQSYMESIPRAGTEAGT